MRPKEFSEHPEKGEGNSLDRETLLNIDTGSSVDEGDEAEKPCFEFTGNKAVTEREKDGSTPTVSKAAVTSLDFREAAHNAFGEALAEPITAELIKGIGLLEGGGEGAATVEEMDDICRVTNMVLDPADFVSSLVDKGVEHVVGQCLVASLGPVGIGIAFFAGKLASELTKQVLDSGSDGRGLRDAEGAIDLAGIVADASIGRLAESDLFRERVSDLVGKGITAILYGDASAVPPHTADQRVGRAATITAVLMTYKVDSPTGGYPAGQQQLTALSARWKRETERAQREGSVATASRLAKASEGVASSGDSQTVRVTCIPEDTVAARWKWFSYKSGFEQGNFLLLTDGTLIQRGFHGGLPGRWASVSHWPVTTDQQEAKEQLEGRGYKLILQSKPAPAPTSAPVHADVLAAYCSLKKWATQNGIQ